ncbi:unnamed protein product [Discula destructiva]
MGSLGDSSPSLSTRSKILFIDAYDSFSNNITSQLTTLLDVDIFVLPIDAPLSKEQFCRELGHYEAVVCGPGPGSPENEADVGLMLWLWELDHADLVPVLGVCLGFQSLVLACGGGIRRLRRGLHGMVRPIQHRSSMNTVHDETDLFNGVGNFKATLYHSLCADIGQDSVGDWDTEKWRCPAKQPDLVPLAWVEEDRGDADGVERILMALKHREKPLWGLQYHPESVCTEEAGNRVVQNWFAQALIWNLRSRRAINTDCRNMLARTATRTSLLQRLRCSDSAGFGKITRELPLGTQQSEAYESRTIPLPHGIEVPDIAEVLDATGKNHIILDSANGDQRPPTSGVDVRGRFSIIGLDVDECMQIQHHTGDEFVTIVNGGTEQGAICKVRLTGRQTIWTVLAEFHASRSNLEMPKLTHEDDLPFLGGFMGYVTYEQGLSGINIALPQDRGHNRPDVCLAWVTKSLVVDHEKRLVHVQNLGAKVEKPQWLQTVSETLMNSALWHYGGRDDINGFSCAQKSTKIGIVKPSKAKYEAKVRVCQEYIAAGESYELCLTDQTRIMRTTTPQNSGSEARHSERGNQGTSQQTESDIFDSSWHLYRTLRRSNPAPFASYLRLGGATLISSSPERFLQYNRTGLCSMKPMKGTVKKSAEPGDGCATTLAEAEAILHIPKEEAENLMIVDLVRHDLHGICGAGRVTVPELLKVEEYQTVYTMITRVEGQLPGFEDMAWPDQGEHQVPKYTGLDVLAASLPPGSMTGAPKKRSCEILQQIEDGKERSLYSGVVGYMCVTGRGDWSVTIRSMHRWDDAMEGAAEEGAGEDKEVWHIGAGGAVTILSTPEGESEEMFVKLARPLSIFNEDG